MKKIYSFAGHALIVTALTVVPAAAQSAGQASSSGGQTTGSGGSSGTQERQGGRTTSYGDRVGEDVPSQGTQTDQRGRTAAQAGQAAAGALQGQDRTFAADAMAGNLAEIELAELAQDKASSPAVKQLAETIQQHHEQANTRLKAIASQSGASDNDAALKPQHKQLHDRLSKLEGPAFDRAYASEMVKEHEKDIQKYEKASKQLQHAGLKAYAAETLPTLKKHLELARAAQGAGQQSTQRNE